MPPNTNTQSDQYSQLVERIGSANNILVTVSEGPTVDQLAGCIGLTIALNKAGKNATAVFSGKVPSTLEFLQPERTIETNTNSLRDFIISLDKSKADKLRYKVEDEFVKIFITPYRTSIDQEDLKFEQGDFNIDLIIMLGVHDRNHLDGAIVAHGRILHDATVASINNDTISELGTINWVNTSASSLCEMASDLVAEIDKNVVDAQIATALLTGMVAETDRFGNEKASPHTMSVAGVLMAAGASTQLVANKLQEPEPEPEVEPETDEPGDEIPELDESKTGEPEAEEKEVPKDNDGTIEIDHSGDPEPENIADEENGAIEPPETSVEEEQPKDDIHIDEDGRLKAIKDLEDARRELEEEAKAAAGETASDETSQKTMTLDPPQLGGQLTANTIAEHEQASPSTDPMSVPSPTPLLARTEPQNLPNSMLPDESDKAEDITPPEMPQDDKTLSEIEKSVNSLHLETETDESKAADENGKDQKTPEDQAEEPVSAATVPPPPPVDDARAAVENAVESTDNYRPEPINALGATPVNLNLDHDAKQVEDKKDDTSGGSESENKNDSDATEDTPHPEDTAESADSAEKKDSKTPPPVPPPFVPGV